MRWNIVTDSSCDLPPVDNKDEQVRVSSVPFIISVGEKDFVDDAALDTDTMLKAMEQCKSASHTSCPTPQSWIEEFEKADQNIAITISSQLSGSMNSAKIARDMVLERCPNKKIAVLDSRSTGPELALCVEKVLEMIRAGQDFEHVVSSAKLALKHTHIAFALSSFDNLIKNGRMSRIAGFIARKLSMWGIGVGSEEGVIDIKGKTRGSLAALSMLIDDMTVRGFRGGKVVISHCQNLSLAEKLRNKIREFWPQCEVRILAARGLCSYYAERSGLILAYES